MSISILSYYDQYYDSKYGDKNFLSVLANRDNYSSTYFIDGESEDDISVKTVRPTDNEINRSLQGLNNFFIPYINSHSIHGNSGILPPGLLYLTKNYLVFEKPPTYHNIFLINKRVDEIDYDECEEYTYRLPIPWQLYIVRFNQNGTNDSVEVETTDVKMHFMQGPLLSIDQPVFLPPLTNFYSTANLCRPMFSDMEDLDRYSKDISGVMQSAHDWVWNSGANLDLTEAIVNYFVQFRFNRENTFYSDFPLPAYHYQTYYCSPEHIAGFYKIWEKIPLSEISLMNWPSSCRTGNMRNDYSEIVMARASDYMAAHGIRVDNDNDPCEDCLQYDEDDGEYHYDECECSCHEYEPSYDHFEVLKWANAFPPKPLSFKESFDKFVYDNNGSQSALTVNRLVLSVLGNLTDSIMLS